MLRIKQNTWPFLLYFYTTHTKILIYSLTHVWYIQTYDQKKYIIFFCKWECISATGNMKLYFGNHEWKVFHWKLVLLWRLFGRRNWSGLTVGNFDWITKMVLYGRKIFNKYLLRKRISQLFFRLLRILFVSRQCLDNFCLGLPEFDILLEFWNWTMVWEVFIWNIFYC